MAMLDVIATQAIVQSPRLAAKRLAHKAMIKQSPRRWPLLMIQLQTTSNKIRTVLHILLAQAFNLVIRKRLLDGHRNEIRNAEQIACKSNQ